MNSPVARCALRLTSSAIVLAGVLAIAPDAAAQGRGPVVRPSRVEIGGGAGWFGQSDVGTRDATFVANLPGPPQPFTFFEVVGKTRSGVVGTAWAGVNLSRAFGVEAGYQYSRPTLSAVIRNDVESTPQTTLTAASFTQYIVEGNLLYHFNRARFDDRHTVPFVLVGAGYLEQRQSDDAVKETGTIYQAGVGFKWTAKIDRALRAHGFGIRLDARYVFRDGGFDFENDNTRSFISAAATAFVAF